MQQQQRTVLQIHHFIPEKNFRQRQKGKLSKIGHSHYEPCMQHNNRRCEYINRISDSHKSSILSSSRQSRLNYAAFYRLLARLVKKKEKKKEGPRHSCNACFPLTEVQLWQKCSTERWNKLIPNDSHVDPLRSGSYDAQGLIWLDSSGIGRNAPRSNFDINTACTSQWVFNLPDMRFMSHVQRLALWVTSEGKTQSSCVQHNWSQLKISPQTTWTINEQVTA